MTACHLAIMDQAHQVHLGLGGSGGGNALDGVADRATFLSYNHDPLAEVLG